MTDLDAVIGPSRRAFVAFAERCASGRSEYRLTPAAEPTAYARCFGVFCRRLANTPFSEPDRSALTAAIRDAVRERRRLNSTDPKGKAFRQLLTFSLSALAALGAIAEDPLEDLVAEQIPENVRSELDVYGSLSGQAGSGNQAMFTAIVMLHARDFLKLDTEDRIQEWVALHLSHMNRFGFWGADTGMTHLQFQNGYHQYEILEFLSIANPRRIESIAAVRSLADAEGHFAPYPGGGGCYDYDAAFLLTPDGQMPDSETRTLLERTAATVLSEQQGDGGFAESLHVRPRHIANVRRTLARVAGSGRHFPLLAERLRYNLALQRPRHDRIHTHWSHYSRRWDESDLWDSWFRLMTIARIHIAIDSSKADEWGFLDYPGIGCHPSQRGGLRS